MNGYNDKSATFVLLFCTLFMLFSGISTSEVKFCQLREAKDLTKHVAKNIISFTNNSRHVLVMFSTREIWNRGINLLERGVARKLIRTISSIDKEKELTKILTNAHFIGNFKDGFRLATNKSANMCYNELRSSSVIGKICKVSGGCCVIIFMKDKKLIPSSLCQASSIGKSNFRKNQPAKRFASKAHPTGQRENIKERIKEEEEKLNRAGKRLDKKIKEGNKIIAVALKAFAMRKKLVNERTRFKRVKDICRGLVEFDFLNHANNKVEEANCAINWMNAEVEYRTAVLKVEEAQLKVQKSKDKLHCSSIKARDKLETAIKTLNEANKMKNLAKQQADTTKEIYRAMRAKIVKSAEKQVEMAKEQLRKAKDAVNQIVTKRKTALHAGNPILETNQDLLSSYVKLCKCFDIEMNIQAAALQNCTLRFESRKAALNFVKAKNMAEIEVAMGILIKACRSEAEITEKEYEKVKHVKGRTKQIPQTSSQLDN